MSYATRADMVARFGDSEVIMLTDRNGTHVIDDAVLTAALAEASAEIDPYLMSRYTLPLTSVPKVLTGKCCDIARYRLGGANVTVTEEMRDRYRDAIKFLDGIAAGKLSLGLDTASQAVSVAGGGVKFVDTTPRVFERGARG
jgi:phage gp36-like protein